MVSIYCRQNDFIGFILCHMKNGRRQSAYPAFRPNIIKQKNSEQNDFRSSARYFYTSGRKARLPQKAFKEVCLRRISASTHIAYKTPLQGGIYALLDYFSAASFFLDRATVFFSTGDSASFTIFFLDAFFLTFADSLAAFSCHLASSSCKSFISSP
ncbi:Uncharacterised protein [Bacteroides pyogenes]|nr:Uncharacterised protein [Bacteroides pyogenes]